MSPEQPGLSPGDHFGPYRLERRIETDLVGERWLATEEGLERYVAVRITSPDLARHPGALSRFVRVCTQAAALEHPNLLPVYRVEEDAGTAYVASRWAGHVGRSKTTRGANAIGPEYAAHLVGQIADALDVAHGRRIFHGAVGRAAVEIDGDHAYLTEFGVGAARAALGQAAEPSMYGDIKGLGDLLQDLMRRSNRSRLRSDRRGISEPLDKTLRRSRGEDSPKFSSAGEFGRAAEGAAGPYRPSRGRAAGVIGMRKSYAAPIAGGAVLLLGAGIWLVSSPGPSSEENEVRSVVERFAGTSACNLMTEELIEASGGPGECRRAFADRGRASLSITSVEITGDIADVSASDPEGNSYQLRLAQEDGDWAVDAISGGPTS